MTLATSTSPIWYPNAQKRFGEHPLKAVSAKGATITLENGLDVLDMTCSWWVNLHGHAHPRIARAIYKQAQTLEQVLFANFTHDPALNLAENLLKHLPPHLGKVFFSDNGSTSIEVALKMAYQYWANKGQAQRKRFLCFENAYHGDTVGAMSASARSVFSKVFSPLLFDVDRVPFPSTFEGDDAIEEKEERSLQAVTHLIEKNKGEYSALLVEPLIQGAAGMRICRPSFLQKLEALVKAHDLLVIYDEVFVGFGRTGDWFACTKSETAPDIVCLSKGITGGFLPLAVSVCTPEIFEAFNQEDPTKSFFHAHSYTANPLGCAAGLASLELLEENPLAFQGMEALHRKYSQPLNQNPRVQRLRFCGCVAAFDIKTDEEDGYMNAIGVALRQKCLNKGVYIRPLGNAVYVMPPYCVSEEELRQVYTVIDESLGEL